MRLLIIILLFPINAEAQWIPPLGIPTPSFGLIEEAGQYTYYIDNTDPNATNISNPNGTIEKPRLSFPGVVPAGSVVEVHGGPYINPTSNFITISGMGTITQPIFYKGVEYPIIKDLLINISGSYIVFEGFHIQSKSIRILGTSSHHISIRNNEVEGQLPKPGGCAVCTGSGSDIVIRRNNLHNNGDPNYFDENDIAGVMVTAGAKNIWIIDNEMYSNGGDSVAINSGFNGIRAHHIYIGRNRMHEEGENAIDIKQSEDVIVSQNDIWGFRPTTFLHSGSDGTAIVVNDDNITNGLNNRIWIIANYIHDSTVGIRTQAYAYLLDNIIVRIEKYGIISFGSHDVHVEHNTITNVGEIGIYRFGGQIARGITVINNIILHVPIAVRVQTIQSSHLSGLLLPRPATIIWGSTTYSSLQTFQAAFPTQCTGCIEGSYIYSEFQQKYQINLGSQ